MTNVPMVTTTTSLSLAQLLEIADSGYPDGGVSLCTDPSHDPMDTLRLFVYRELSETFDDGECADGQVGEAIRVLETAMRDLRDTLYAFEKYAREHDLDC